MIQFQYSIELSRTKMKKYLGINHNKISEFQEAKLSIIKKKNRFKIAGKEQPEIITDNSTANTLITNTTQYSPNQESQEITSPVVEAYDQAMKYLKKTNQMKKKISEECNLRITTFRESQAKKYDENICRLSKTAINCLLDAEKCLAKIRKMTGQSLSQEKYLRNVERSVAQLIREKSKELRTQQKQHYERIRTYDIQTKNMAIQLSQKQKQKMKSHFDFESDISTSGILEEVQADSHKNQINGLVQSINQLSSIYKQLNELVIMQGSIIDRIDVNIQETMQSVKEGKKHLKNADDNASSPYAQKCMIILISLIMILAVILGLKYSKE